MQKLKVQFKVRVTTDIYSSLGIRSGDWLIGKNKRSKTGLVSLLWNDELHVCQYDSTRRTYVDLGTAEIAPPDSQIWGQILRIEKDLKGLTEDED